MGALRFFRSVGSLTAEETGSSDRPTAPPRPNKGLRTYPKLPPPRSLPLTPPPRPPLACSVYLPFYPLLFFSFFFLSWVFFWLARKGVLWPCSCLSLSLLFPAHFPTPIASSFSHGALRPTPNTPSSSFQQIRR